MNRRIEDSEERGTYSIDDVAKILGISRGAAYRAAKRDDLPAPVIRIGKKLLVSKQALRAALEAKKPTQ